MSRLKGYMGRTREVPKVMSKERYLLLNHMKDTYPGTLLLDECFVYRTNDVVPDIGDVCEVMVYFGQCGEEAGVMLCGVACQRIEII